MIDERTAKLIIDAHVRDMVPAWQVFSHLKDKYNVDVSKRIAVKYLKDTGNYMSYHGGVKHRVKPKPRPWGGYRPGSGVGKKSYHIKPDGSRIFCDSSYEVRVCKIFDRFGVTYIKIDGSQSHHHVLYYNGIKHVRYYPDFYLLDLNLYVEVKGYVTEQTIVKHVAAINEGKRLVILQLSEIEFFEKLMDD